MTTCSRPWPALGRAAALLALSLTIALEARADVPAHPDELTFPALDFVPPRAVDFRHELSGGVPVFLVPSREFPLITVTFTFHGGTFLEPAEQSGLAAALGQMIRRGGTRTVSAEEVDERFDFLAARVGSFVGPETSSATLNCLTSNFDQAFALFLDMLRNPGFDAERLRVHQDEVLEELKQRNDSPMSVAMMNVSELAFGPDHYLGRLPTQATIERITPASLRALHARIFHPGNLVIAATGDFDETRFLQKLDAALTGWQAGAPAPTPAGPTQPITPGLAHAAVTQEDLPQGTALIITRTVERDDPDAIPLTVMNHVLGGGGFSSRITNRVRSDEGLAYAASSFVQPQVHFPGIFAAFFASKNSTVALATKLVMEEIERIRTEPVSEAELETARNAFIEQLPQRFASKRTVLNVFVNDEMTDRDPDYWQTFRTRIEAVTAEDVQRVAHRYLVPDDMLILVVGDWDAIYPGDRDGRASMNDFFDGNVTHRPARDPLTLEPLGP